MAAVRSAGIVVAVEGDGGGVGEDFLADLERLGPVRAERLDRGASNLGLSPEQEELLRQVATGMSVAEAATELYLSRRTAERRLALARAVLGVATTAEAIGRLVDAGRANA
jgi:DNA-binding NarL/FixJ family response regulator